MERLNLRQLEIFSAVVDAGSFTAAAEKLFIDILLMDPPRSGSTPEFLSAAVKMAPRRIVYISCCPETQARDLALLQKGGYRVTLLQPVDMFPHTEHIENIAVLERRSTR